MRIGIHKMHNSFPFIFYYIWPRLLNKITRDYFDTKIYKWLWWYIEIPAKSKSEYLKKQSNLISLIHITDLTRYDFGYPDSMSPFTNGKYVKFEDVMIFFQKLKTEIDILINRVEQAFTFKTKLKELSDIVFELRIFSIFYYCEDCKHIEKCKQIWGNEYYSIIGSHHCRKDWDQFIKEKEG